MVGSTHIWIFQNPLEKGIDKKHYPPITYEYAQEEIAAKAGINIQVVKSSYRISIFVYNIARVRAMGDFRLLKFKLGVQKRFFLSYEKRNSKIFSISKYEKFFILELWKISSANVFYYCTQNNLFLDMNVHYLSKKQPRTFFVKLM